MRRHELMLAKDLYARVALRTQSFWPISRCGAE
jgi:hypothetical protein